MKRLAVFCEGQTEHLFAQRLITECAGQKGLSITHQQASGGGRSHRIIRTTYKVDVPAAEYFCLIFDCGTDGKVIGDVRERYSGLLSQGFDSVVGIRDAYPNYTLADLVRARASHQAIADTFVQVSLPFSLIFGVMEIEAWFVADATHYKRISAKLTPKVVRSTLGYDPAVYDIQLVAKPTVDLRRVYKVGKTMYSKSAKSVQRTVNALDIDSVYHDHPARFMDFAELVAALDAFFA